MKVFKYSFSGYEIPVNVSTNIITSLGELKVPANSFSEPVSIRITQPISIPEVKEGKATGIGIEIELSKNIQPLKEITISIKYNQSDIEGFNEDKLVIVRWDENNKIWIPLPSTVDKINKRVIAQTNHLSLFQIIEGYSYSNLEKVTMGPNPYLPLRFPDKKVTFRNLPSNSIIKIYTYVGEMVKEIKVDNSEVATWDGKNTEGKLVASGVYVVLIKYNNEKKILKLMLEK